MVEVLLDEVSEEAEDLAVATAEVLQDAVMGAQMFAIVQAVSTRFRIRGVCLATQ
jgi:hypothetical protein